MKEIILQEVTTFLKERGVYNYATGNSEVSFETSLKNDLSLDSLEIAELICEMENIYGIDISSDNNIPTTVGELCEAYDVTITADMLEPENFNSAQAMLNLVERIQDEF